MTKLKGNNGPMSKKRKCDINPVITKSEIKNFLFYILSVL